MDECACHSCANQPPSSLQRWHKLARPTERTLRAPSAWCRRCHVTTTRGSSRKHSRLSQFNNVTADGLSYSPGMQGASASAASPAGRCQAVSGDSRAGPAPATSRCAPIRRQRKQGFITSHVFFRIDMSRCIIRGIDGALMNSTNIFSLQTDLCDVSRTTLSTFDTDTTALVPNCFFALRFVH